MYIYIYFKQIKKKTKLLKKKKTLFFFFFLTHKFLNMEGDLTFALASHLDKHLVLPLLNHLEYISENDKQGYDIIALRKSKHTLLTKTYLFDEDLELLNNLPKDDKICKEISATNKNKEIILQELIKLDSKLSRLIDLLSNDKLIKDLISKKIFNYNELQKYDISRNEIELLHDYCYLRYNIGVYENTDTLLKYFIALTNNPNKKYQALWGKLAIEILLVIFFFYFFFFFILFHKI